MAEREKDPRIISSLQRALDILSLFGPQAPELGITDIAKALNLHKSTASGLVYTLERNGYISQNPANRRYQLGLQLVERAGVLLDQIEIRKIAMPELEHLRDWSSESVNLAILEENQIIYIERLMRQFEDFRQQGFAIEREENAFGGLGIAAQAINGEANQADVVVMNLEDAVAGQAVHDCL